ncbi:MAG: GNAT family N-acetyltransferase [Actinobacteria bacterium]|nr:GNAT family N-acetyltransferase [Actinomycetota bacterium]
MTELRTHAGFPSGPLRAEWEVLVTDDPDGTIFHTPRYLETWHRVLGQRTHARVRTVHRDGRLIGVVPEAHEREGSPTGPIEVIRFMGGTEVTDYLGPVARPEDRADVVTAYLEALVGDVDWDELVVSGIPADTAWPTAFLAEAERLGIGVLEDADEAVCPRLDIADGYDAYLDRLPGKQRHELKRKARKLARDLGGVRLVEVPDADVEEGLETFFEMATETDTEKSGFFAKDDMRRFFRELADEFAGERVLRLHLLEVAGAPGAATVSLVQGPEWGLYNSAFDQSLASLAPGMVLVGELIRMAAEEGCRVFDLLRGDEPYKYRFGAVDRSLRRLTLARR